ncbi:glycosyltransferase family 2 protein [Gemmatimonadota bacterium]
MINDVLGTDGRSLVDRPLVSIIMNCHNGEKYLREAVDSVIHQTYSRWELIFWDNRSTDESAHIIQSYSDPRVSYYLSDSFTPLGEARNCAVKNATGELIAFLDCDDLWMPEKLAKQVPLFADAKVGLAISDTQFFNEKGTQKRLYRKRKPAVGMVFKELLGSYFISLETAVIRRSALESLDHWFDPRFDVIEEYDLFVRLAYTWHLAYVDEVLAKWRVHGSSWTWTRNELFPVERRLMLAKLRAQIPAFNRQYAREAGLIERASALEEAQAAWKNRDSREARNILRPHCRSSIKCLIVYFLTRCPYAWIEFFRGFKDVRPG